MANVFKKFCYQFVKKLKKNWIRQFLSEKDSRSIAWKLHLITWFYRKSCLSCVAYQRTFKEFSILFMKISKRFQVHVLILLSIYLYIIFLYFLWYTTSCVLLLWRKSLSFLVINIYIKPFLSHFMYITMFKISFLLWHKFNSVGVISFQLISDTKYQNSQSTRLA